MKKYVITSMILILVPTILFVPFCFLIYHSTLNNSTDYSQKVLGTWNAFQYYIDQEMFICNDEDKITVTINQDNLSISGAETILAPTNEANYIWKSGVSLSYTIDNMEVTLYISFDSHGNMILKLAEGKKTIYLRKAETVL